MPSGHKILTIGHSNHPLEHVISLLKQHAVQVVVDARSQPYSKYSPQYDANRLKLSLPKSGFQYLYMGRELGGRPEHPSFYDTDGHVLYSRVAETPDFLSGIARLESGMRDFRLALLCSEENPAACHRRLLVTSVLKERGVAVDHILGDGRIQSEEELTASEAKPEDQLALFAYAAIPEWKSIPSVLPKRRLSASSGS